VPLHHLHPDVIAELRALKADRVEQQRQVDENRTDSRLKGLDARLRRLEAEPRSDPAPAPLDESFWKELVGMMREYVNQQTDRVKNEVAAVANRVKFLETQPQLEYRGVYDPGANYQKNSLVTYDGCLWIAKSATGSAPGNPGGSDWKMCVKRGRDGRDAKGAK
jgi:hypothetical protein